MKQKVVRTYLNACVGEFPADLDPLPDHFVYFMRSTDGLVPTPNSLSEAEEQLQAHFETGVVTGHSLEMLEQLLTQASPNYSCFRLVITSVCSVERTVQKFQTIFMKLRRIINGLLMWQPFWISYSIYCILLIFIGIHKVAPPLLVLAVVWTVQSAAGSVLSLFLNFCLQCFCHLL